METIFLERWLHDIIRQRVKQDPEYRQFINRESLAKVTRADIENFQLFRLRKILAYSYEKIPFYRELFDKNDIKPDDVRSLSDLAKLPFTSPEDLAENAGRFVNGSPSGDVRVVTFTTFGATSPQKKLFYTEADIERMTDFMGAAMRTVTAAGDVVQIILPFGRENNQGDLLARGLEKMGAFPVKAGITLTAEEQLEHKYVGDELVQPKRRQVRNRKNRAETAIHQIALDIQSIETPEEIAGGLNYSLQLLSE